MKKNIIITIVLLSLVGIGYNYKKFRIAPRISFPSLEVINDKNETVKLTPTSGKLRVISFYASWCPDCKREFPKMKQAMETNYSDFEFIAITEEGVDSMNAFKDKYKYPFTFYTLPFSFEEYDIYAIPTTYIINAKNEILYSKVGDIDWNEIHF
jgi:thiol-disulfide isomerase/thioredoxin